jgi:hypothetical protein
MDVSELHAQAFYPRGKQQQYPFHMDQVGPGAGLNVMENRKILPLLANKLRPSSPKPVAITTELSRNLTYIVRIRKLCIYVA